MKPKIPPVSWNNFCRNYPPFSVAIDGFVNGPPQIDQIAFRANFNHHEGVSRLETRATCAQVFMAIKMGFFNIFDTFDARNLNVYGNHCDEDSCLSWFMLAYGYSENIIKNPLLERLVIFEDFSDTTGGMYPFPLNFPMLEKAAWIFSPYYQFKLKGSIDKQEEHDYFEVVQGVSERIQQYLSGRGKKLSLDLRYIKKAGGSGWFFIKEIGAQARRGMMLDGIRAFVTVREVYDGKWIYTIERASKFVSFDVTAIISALNHAEGKTDADEDRWGGSSDRGGSPRVNGSALSPETVAKVINNLII